MIGSAGSEEPEPPIMEQDNAASRAVIAGLSLLAFAVGLVGVVLDAGPARWIGLLVFVLLGVGSAPWQLNRALRLPARLALTVLTSFAVLTIVALSMMAAHDWRPGSAFAAVAAVCVPLHLIGGWLAIQERRAVARRTGLTGLVATLESPAVAAGTMGAALCLMAALAHRQIEPGIGGFLPRIGPLWYAGLVIILLAVVSGRADDERQQLVPVLLLLVVLTITPALVYDGPRSQSAAKHVDLIQQIRTLHRTDSVVEVYNAWPGFFAAMAWLCDITGIRDPMRLAAFWPPLIGVLRIAALRYFAGQVLSSAYRCWVAVALAVLVDSLGTDYFSPQSVGLVVGLITFGLALAPSRSDGARHIRSRLRPWLILLAGGVLMVSHQLSPYIVAGALAVLVVFRQVRPWWTPALILGPALGWTLLHSGAVSRFISLSQIGRLQNFRPPPTTATPGLERLPIVGATVDALVLAVGLVGLLALVTLIVERRNPRAWAMACCPGVGVALVAVNPYGQEGSFRAAVFGIPWLALLAATRFAPAHRGPVRARLFATLALLTATFVVASFGLDASNVSRPADVAAFDYVRTESAPRPQHMYYLLQLGAGDLPGPVAMRAANYRPLTGEDLGTEPVRAPTGTPAEADRQVAAITVALLDYSREPLGAARFYAIWSPASSAYAAEYAMQRPERFAALREAFVRSPYWTIGFARDGTVVFRFQPDRYRGGMR